MIATSRVASLLPATRMRRHTSRRTWTAAQRGRRRLARLDARTTQKVLWRCHEGAIAATSVSMYDQGGNTSHDTSPPQTDAASVVGNQRLGGRLPRTTRAATVVPTTATMRHVYALRECRGCQSRVEPSTGTRTASLAVLPLQSILPFDAPLYQYHCHRGCV